MANHVDLPHKTAYEACNPDHNLISEVQVAEDEGIKLVTPPPVFTHLHQSRRRHPPRPGLQGRGRYPLVHQRRRRGVEGQARRDQGAMPPPHATAIRPPPLTHPQQIRKKHHHGTHRR